MKTIYVLGSLNMDLVISSDRLPIQGETLKGKNFSTCPGGKGLNQAIAAAKIGAKVKMLGAVGNDVFGEELINALKINKVDVSHIRHIENASSGVAIIVLCNNDNRIILDLGANLLIENDNVDQFLFDAREGDIFLTQLENEINIIGYALEVAKKKNMITIVNPAPMNIDILKFKNYIDVLTPNELELKDLLKDTSLIDIGITNIIETRGKEGYRYFFNGKKEIQNKAIEVNVVDTTGAGDTFNGALSYQLSIGNKLDENSLDFASLAASISITRKGSSSSSPTLLEVNNYNKKHYC